MDEEFQEGLIDIAELFCDDPFAAKDIEKCISQILVAIGEDPNRDGLKRTPARVARSYAELLEGYRIDPIALINDALFDVDYEEPVLVRDIEFYSMCEHHMLPVIGRAHVEYIPQGKIIGLSKIPRIVDMFSRRLQVQERMTKQIADFINRLLNPAGVAVVIEGLHLCSMMRGVQKHNARMTTSSMYGIYQDDTLKRREFMENISRGAESLHI